MITAAEIRMIMETGEIIKAHQIDARGHKDLKSRGADRHHFNGLKFFINQTIEKMGDRNSWCNEYWKMWAENF